MKHEQVKSKKETVVLFVLFNWNETKSPAFFLSSFIKFVVSGSCSWLTGVEPSQAVASAEPVWLVSLISLILNVCNYPWCWNISTFSRIFSKEKYASGFFVSIMSVWSLTWWFIQGHVLFDLLLLLLLWSLFCISYEFLFCVLICLMIQWSKFVLRATNDINASNISSDICVKVNEIHLHCTVWHVMIFISLSYIEL